MDADKFVELVERFVYQTAVRVTSDNLASPPGFRPPADMIEMSRWFNKLELSDQRYVTRIIERSAAEAVFGFLCVIDGARSIETGPDKGAMELYYVKGTHRILLNDRNKEPLNDKW